MAWGPSDIEAALAVGGVAAGALGGAVRWVTKPVKKIAADLDFVKAELIPNGGGSLKDLVVQTRDLSLMTLAIQDATLETSSSGHWRSDADGHCVAVNGKLCEVLERQPAEILGDGWRTCIAPADADRIAKLWDDCIHQHRNFEAVYSYVKPSGVNTVPLRVKAQIIRNLKHEVVGFLGTVVGPA